MLGLQNVYTKNDLTFNVINSLDIMFRKESQSQLCRCQSFVPEGELQAHILCVASCDNYHNLSILFKSFLCLLRMRSRNMHIRYHYFHHIDHTCRLFLNKIYFENDNQHKIDSLIGYLLFRKHIYLTDRSVMHLTKIICLKQTY